MPKNTDDKVIELEAQNGSDKKEKGNGALYFKDLGNGVEISVFPDFMNVYMDYYRKLLRARGVPQDATDIRPGDKIVKWFVAQPEFQTMSGEMQQEAIYNEAVSFYEGVQDATREDAGVMALTTTTQFNNDPKPYAYPERRKIPGMADQPLIEYNLANLIEYRLKQTLDAFREVDGAMDQLVKTLRHWVVKMEVESQQDKDGFRS